MRDAEAPAADTPVAPPPLFTSSDESPRRGGITLWFAAAASLIVGILIGFASGYRAGTAARVVAPAVVTPSPSAASAPATGGQAFSEAAVTEPVRLDPEPIVPPPEEKPVRPAPPRRTDAPARPPTRAAAVRPAVSGPGSLQVVSHPTGAQVVLDGRAIGRTPLGIPDVSTGSHSIRLELPGFKRWATTVDVTPGARTRVAASLEQ